MSNDKQIWQSIAARKKAEQAALISPSWRLPRLPDPLRTSLLDIPSTCGILNPRELQITSSSDATALLQCLLNRTYTAEEVTLAFCKRAAIAHQLTNCLTEILFDSALSHAHSLDESYARTGNPSGPLHGLPISLKDTFRITGTDASIGIAALCFKPATSNSALVDVLLNAGAVLYCKTNVPQTMMALDSHNNVFGRTLNPANTKLTAGGSSGGEGALVAMRGSLLGVGTDVGGSVRIPAMCNGLVGIKPSHGRVPFAGQEGGAKPGSEVMGLRASAGPIAWSVRDCELLLKTVADERAWEVDPEVVPQPWEGQEKLQVPMHGAVGAQPLRIGILRTDGTAAPLPPVEGLMDQVANSLRASHPTSGVPAIEGYDLDLRALLKRCQSLANKAFSVEGANNWFDLLEATGEPLSPWLQSRLRRRPQYSLDRTKDVHGQRSELQTEFLRVWDSQGGFWKPVSGDRSARLDAIICPVAPHPVPEVDRWNTASYTATFVLLDYPAATLTVRKMQSADLQGEVLNSEPLSSWDKYNKTLWTDVDRNVYLNSPMCIQIVTQKLQDRKLVEVMKILEDVLVSKAKSTHSKL